jgi:hypothetical protein
VPRDWPFRSQAFFLNNFGTSLIQLAAISAPRTRALALCGARPDHQGVHRVRCCWCDRCKSVGGQGRATDGGHRDWAGRRRWRAATVAGRGGSGVPVLPAALRVDFGPDQRPRYWKGTTFRGGELPTRYASAATAVTLPYHRRHTIASTPTRWNRNAAPLQSTNCLILNFCALSAPVGHATRWRQNDARRLPGWLVR